MVCCHARQQAEQVKARLAGWLAPRGLAFNDEKTKIVSPQAGYDFLGFNIRRYRCALCADLLLHADREPHTPEEWQRWHRTTRKAITRQLIAREPGTPDATRLIHTYCQRRATGANSREPASSRT